MPSFTHPDEEDCTASPGTMGHLGCHLYPGCGCHQDTRPKEPGDDREVTLEEVEEVLKDPSAIFPTLRRK